MSSPAGRPGACPARRRSAMRDQRVLDRAVERHDTSRPAATPGRARRAGPARPAGSRSQTWASVVITSISRRMRSTRVEGHLLLRQPDEQHGAAAAGEPLHARHAVGQAAGLDRDVGQRRPGELPDHLERVGPDGRRRCASRPSCRGDLQPTRVDVDRHDGAGTGRLAPGDDERPDRTGAVHDDDVARAGCGCGRRRACPTASGWASAALSSETCGAMGWSIAAGTVIRSVRPPSADRP